MLHCFPFIIGMEIFTISCKKIERKVPPGGLEPPPYGSSAFQLPFTCITSVWNSSLSGLLFQDNSFYPAKTCLCHKLLVAFVFSSEASSPRILAKNSVLAKSSSTSMTFTISIKGEEDFTKKKEPDKLRLTP